MEKAIHSNENYLRQVRFMFETERRASSDTAERLELTKKIAEITGAITTHNKSNSLKGELVIFNFKKARDNFKDAAINFKTSMAQQIDSGTEDNDIALVTENNDAESTYKEALSCFRKLMFADYPHWFDCRSNSTSLKPRPLALVSDADAMLATQLQLAKTSLTGITGRYGSVESYV